MGLIYLMNLKPQILAKISPLKFQRTRLLNGHFVFESPKTLQTQHIQKVVISSMCASPLGVCFWGVTVVATPLPKPETSQPVITFSPWPRLDHYASLAFLRSSSLVRLLFLNLESYCLCLPGKLLPALKLFSNYPLLKGYRPSMIWPLPTCLYCVNFAHHPIATQTLSFGNM